MVGWRILLWAVLVLIVLLFLYQVRGILLPFIVSFIIAALLEPSVRRLRLRGYSRRAAVTLVMSAFFLVVIALGILFGPRLSAQVVNLTHRATEFARGLATPRAEDNFFLRWNPAVVQPTADPTGEIDRILERYGPQLERVGLPATRQAIFAQYIEPQRPRIAAAAQAAVASLFGFVTNLFSQILFVILVPLLVPLMLLDMENFRQRTPRWIPPSIRASTLAMMGDIGRVFINYLRGISTVVLLFIVSMSALFLFFEVPYAILLGILFGALYLVPYLGNLISTVILFAVIGFGGVQGNFLFTLPNAWVYAIIVTVLFQVIGTVFDYLIYPQMVGGSVGLSPVVSVFVIFSGAALFGLPGMIIAYPLAGAVKVVLDRVLRVTSTTGDKLDLPSVPIRHRTVET
jgi:predicted PurR-regulated permease PerM